MYARIVAGHAEVHLEGDDHDWLAPVEAIPSNDHRTIEASLDILQSSLMLSFVNRS